jgi:hypothetical protein
MFLQIFKIFSNNIALQEAPEQNNRALDIIRHIKSGRREKHAGGGKY